ncbi:MAG: aspartate aminotransferase family protein [Promethearchaeota archaeon]|nr:MAG: aspartate aminotransferase family protein [Candidatus Lokiarchaeota archaeon]
MADFEPKIVSKEELSRISADVNPEELLLFENHCLNVHYESKVLLGAKEPGSPWVVVKDFKTGERSEIIDCSSQNWTLALGFAHPDVNFAVSEQMKRLTHVKSSAVSPARAKFFNKLAELAPGRLKGGRVHINNSGGSLALEAAIKLALVASKDGEQFLVFRGGYHGNTLAMITASQPIHSITRFRPFGIESFVRCTQPYCYRCMWNYKNGLYGKKDPQCNLECFELVREYLMGLTTRKLAAVILEVCQAAGGHIPFPPEFLVKLREVCEQEKILIIYDESQTGVWRTGKYFTLTEKYEKELGIDVSPDMMCFTKAIGGGFPLGAMIASASIRKRYTPAEDHTTFSNTPIGLTAGLAAFRVIEKAKLGENCEERGNQITKRLKELQQKYDVIGDIRGPGLFIGIELVKDQQSREPFTDLLEEMLLEGVKQNIFFGPSMPYLSGTGKIIMRNLIKIKPPLVITEQDADYICDKFESVLKASLNNLNAQ